VSADTANCERCGQPVEPGAPCRHCDEAGHVFTIQDWRPLLTLGLIIALGFSFTRLVVNAYDEKRQELAEQYYAAGTRAMEAQHPEQAVDAFEGALIYSHDNFDYQLRLTDALLASGATSEAVAQLHSFLDQRPGDAQVNLKLARLEARRHHVDEALRYYLAAIEGDWAQHSDPFPQRIAVRFESAEYLVDQGRKQEAENALQQLAAVLPVAWPEQGKLGDLFLRIGDAPRAVTVYQAQLNQDADDQAALLGAAKADLMLANYAAARHELTKLSPQTDESKTLLAQMDRMEALDPFANHADQERRMQRTIAAFHIATQRLSSCGVDLPVARTTPGAAAGSASSVAGDKRTQPRLAELGRWAAQLAPMMNAQRLRGRDDLIESAMRFVFVTELTAERRCGKAAKPSVDDDALLLLARERMGVAQ